MKIKKTVIDHLHGHFASRSVAFVRRRLKSIEMRTSQVKNFFSRMTASRTQYKFSDAIRAIYIIQKQKYQKK